jgi:hypothetical protein
MGFSSLLQSSDYMFGVRPQLLINGKKRFQSKIGGLFFYLYLVTLLTYVAILSSRYASNETKDITK